MKQIVYTGTSDFQVFEKEDFEKAGIDQKKTLTFPKGEAVEVEDEVADALTNTDADNIFGGHSFAEADEKNSVNYKKPQEVDTAGEPEPVIDPKKTGRGAGKAGATSAGGNTSTAGSGSST